MSKLQEDLEGTRAFTGPRRKGETTQNPDREAERALRLCKERRTGEDSQGVTRARVVPLGTTLFQ